MAQAQMSTAAIDLDMLNELFENQKRLDDAFNSMFDDDAFLSDLKVSETKTSRSRARQEMRPLSSKEGFSDAVKEKTIDQSSRSILHVLIPVALEIALIVYGILYFS